ncbi:hypothetical protein GC167_02155 [bacterium]|nr:hypothetical protein [bacterium]
MKTLRIALLALVGIIALGLIYLSTQPAGYSVERSVEIKAPALSVQQWIVDLPKWEQWSSWSRMDSTNQTTYSDPSSGKGAWYSWKGDITGEGKLEIVDVEEGKRVATAIQFTKPFESLMDSRFEFEEANGVTRVRWINEGKMPFLFRFMNKGMDKAMGPDLEKGLEAMKALAETQASAMPTGSVAPAEVVNVQKLTYFYARRAVKSAEITADLFAQAYGEVMGYLAEDASKVNGAPFAIAELWDEETDNNVLLIAMPCTSAKPGNAAVQKGVLPAGKAVKVVYTGPYEGSAMGHEAASAYMETNGLESNGAPWESYVNDPGEVKDPALYITEVFYPIK